MPQTGNIITNPSDEYGQNQYIIDPITGKRTKRYPGMEGFLPQYVQPQMNNDAWGGWSGTYGNHGNNDRINYRTQEPGTNPGVYNMNSPAPQGQGTQGVYGNNPISTAPMPAASNPAGLTQPSIVPAASLGGPSSQMSTPYTPLKFTSPFSVGRNVPEPNGGSFRHRIPNSGFSGAPQMSQPQTPMRTPPGDASSQAMLIRRGR
jgi:hypothetical protein